MGKIVVSQNVSLDGVVEDPSGEQGFRHGGWFVQFMAGLGGVDELELGEAQRAEALLSVAGATSTSRHGRHPRAASGWTG